MSTQKQTCGINVLASKHYSLVHSCEKCPYITKSLFFIRSHIKRQHSSNNTFLFDCAENTPEVYFCKECNFKTYDTVIFNIHLKEHNASFRQFEENLQNEDSEFELKTEVFEEHELKPLENHEIAWSLHELLPSKFECSLLFKTRAICENLNDKNTKWFKCDNRASIEWLYCNECPFKVKKKYVFNLRNHIIVKHTPLENIKWFHCDKCDFKTKLVKYLQQHMTVKHTTSLIKWFQCDKCAYKTKYKQCFKQHISAKHTPLENMKWFHCGKCDFKAKLEKYLKQHIHHKHTPLEKVQWFHCEKCDYKAKLKRYLKEHIHADHMSAEDAEWLNCDKCPYKVKTWRNYDLRNHMIVKHTPLENIKWIQCDKCDFKAKHNSNMQRHMTAKHTTSIKPATYNFNETYNSYKAKIKRNFQRHLNCKNKSGDNIK